MITLEFIAIVRFQLGTTHDRKNLLTHLEVPEGRMASEDCDNQGMQLRLQGHLLVRCDGLRMSI